jgi:chromosome segregation ATPase
MHPSFAQFPRPLYALVLALALGGCATLPPPTAELSAAQQAVSRADGADADQHAAELISQARSGLAQAQAAMAQGRHNDARLYATLAAADADLAHARSREAVANQELAQRRGEIAELRQRLQVEDGQ